MSLEKINFILKSYENALKRLKEALNEDLNKSSVIIDGIIQRFEFNFEISWKLIKSFLEFNGILCNSPRNSIKEAYKFGLINDESNWISLMEDRNLSTHIYNENMAKGIVERIRTIYSKLFDELVESIRTHLKKI